MKSGVVCAKIFPKHCVCDCNCKQRIRAQPWSVKRIRNANFNRSFAKRRRAFQFQLVSVCLLLCCRLLFFVRGHWLQNRLPKDAYFCLCRSPVCFVSVQCGREVCGRRVSHNQLRSRTNLCGYVDLPQNTCLAQNRPIRVLEFNYYQCRASSVLPAKVAEIPASESPAQLSRNLQDSWQPGLSWQNVSNSRPLQGVHTIVLGPLTTRESVP